MTFAHNLLAGTLPSEIATLLSCSGSLTYLDLSNNHIQGPIPPEWGLDNCADYLDLSYNSVSGTLPTELGNYVL
jgi:hypothetical protein